MTYQRWVRSLLIAALIVIITGAVQISPAPAQDATPWPTAGWATSTPEEQGIDSVKLAKMFAFIQSQNFNIHSVVIVRHGVLVAEAYRAPQSPDTLHLIMSCTKSFTSALIGIAIAQGSIQGVDQRVLDLFPDRTAAHLDDAKRGMTLENLLTMSGGFEWTGGMLEAPSLGEMWGSGDWVQFMLDRPLSDPPGSRFVYNSGGSHLLSAIVQQTTGLSAEEFAAQHLFAPLGIDRWSWESDPQGISAGGWGLWITPRDMAKFGYLYLHGGEWDGQQVIPAAWVAESTRAQIAAGGVWPTGEYGYQWWIDGQGYFMALGYGGQYIVVVPDSDLVVTFTSGLPLKDFVVPENLLDAFILPASESPEPLPANPEGNAALQAAVDALEQPAAGAVPPLPDMARTISGQTYTLEANAWGLTSLSLTFTGGDTAQLTLDGTHVFAVGLDGVLRPSEEAEPALFDLPVALRGAWRRDSSFVMDLFMAGTAENLTLTLSFEGASLNLRWRENVAGTMGSFRGSRASSN